MAKIMQMANLSNKASRNGFDLSFKNAMTAKSGEILPLGAIHTLPGDEIDINISSFTRTMPVNTAAYTRIREYVDVWFVPYRLLWNKFDTFSTNMLDNPQHAAGSMSAQNVTEQHPYLTVQGLAEYIHSMKVNKPENHKNAFGFDRAELTCKLLEYLDYGDYTEYLTNTWTSKKRQNFDLNPFSLLAYQKVYQDSFRHEQWESAQPWAYNLDYMTGEDMSIDMSTIKLNDGKQNMFDLRYCNWEKDYFFGVLPDSQYGEESVVPMISKANGPVVSDGHYLGQGGTNYDNRSVILGNGIGDGHGNRLYKLKESGGGNPLQLSIPADLVDKINGYVNDLSILELRKAEFVQKWKEIAQSGDQDFKTQISKFWNVNVPKTLSNMCTHLGSSITNLDITEVVNSNLQNDGAAEIAGQCRGAGQGHIHFSSKDFGNEFGVILITYHNRPLLDYSTDGINRFNLKTRYADYANPAFDRLGMQEVYLAEVDNSSTIYANSLQADTSSMFLGFAPRYAEYKTSIDRVHGEFRKSLSSWVAPITSSYFEKFYQFSRSGIVSKVNYNLFKVNPNIVDSIFVQKADSSTKSDQFLVNAAFDVKAVRNLDYNGLPY